MVNRAGSTFAFRIAEETGAPADDIVRAHIAAGSIFEGDEMRADIDALDGIVDVDTQCRMHLELRKLVERSSRWLVRYRPRPLPIAATVAELEPGVAECASAMHGLLRGSEREWRASFRSGLTSLGVPEPLAERVAGLESLTGALDIVDVALATGRPVVEVTAMWCAIGDRLRLDWLRDRILDDLPRDDRWHALARSALRDDLANERRALVASVLAVAPGVPADDALDRWIAQHPGIVHAMGVLDDLEKEATYDVSTLSVALRELRNLSQGDTTLALLTRPYPFGCQPEYGVRTTASSRCRRRPLNADPSRPGPVLDVLRRVGWPALREEQPLHDPPPHLAHHRDAGGTTGFDDNGADWFFRDALLSAVVDQRTRPGDGVSACRDVDGEAAGARPRRCRRDIARPPTLIVPGIARSSPGLGPPTSRSVPAIVPMASGRGWIADEDAEDDLRVGVARGDLPASGRRELEPDTTQVPLVGRRVRVAMEGSGPSSRRPANVGIPKGRVNHAIFARQMPLSSVGARLSSLRAVHNSPWPTTGSPSAHAATSLGTSFAGTVSTPVSHSISCTRRRRRHGTDLHGRVLRVPHTDADDRDDEHGRGGTRRAHAAAVPIDSAAHPVTLLGCRPRRRTRKLAELFAKVFDVHGSLPSRSTRRLRKAWCKVAFTVPSAHAITSAMSATVRSAR